MTQRILLLQCFFILSVITPVIGQIQLIEFNDFVEPVGNWVQASEVKKDSLNPEILTFEKGSDCFVNGENGKAKYLVSKKKYQDIELNLEFMLPKGSNSGIYFQSRYEIQLFDSWGVKDLTFYDCAGIQQRWDKNEGEEKRGIDGHAPKTNACKEPGKWQTLDVIFRAPKFNSKGEKIKNAQFDKVVLNGIIVHEKVELTGPTKGALSEMEVASASFRLQGGHGPVAFRNVKVKDLDNKERN